MEPLPIASYLVIVNDNRDDLIVCVEPWGVELALGDGETAKVIIRASTPEPTRVRTQHGRITLESLGAGEVNLEIWVGVERIH